MICERGEDVKLCTQVENGILYVQEIILIDLKYVTEELVTVVTN